MKKIYTFFICVTLLCSTFSVFTGCSASDSGDSNTSGKTETTASSSSTNSKEDGNSQSDDSSATGTRGSTLQILTPSADGTEVYENSSAIIDVSNKSEGYCMVNYIGTSEKVKLQISGPEDLTYTFSLHGGYETFPLTQGDGTYKISVYENIVDTQYATALSASVEVTIENTFGAYLYPNQYVNYEGTTLAVEVSEDLAKNTSSDLDVVMEVYDYIIQNFSYDYDLANTVQSGYLPNVDHTLETKTGICFDYAAVMASLLRMQNIPTRMELGYVDEVYHAWISIYTEETGWINGIIQFNGSSWEMLDPTFASTSSKPENFIPSDSDYILKYVY